MSHIAFCDAVRGVYDGYWFSTEMVGQLQGRGEGTLHFNATAPAEGKWTLDADTGYFSWTPPNNRFSDTVVIPFTVTDGSMTSNTGSMVIIGWHLVTYDDAGDQGPESNDSAIGSPKQYSVLQGGTLTADAPGVLAGDYATDYPAGDDDGTVGFSQWIDQPQHGSIADLGADGRFTYTADADFTGTDWFTLQLACSDGGGKGEYQTVFIDVQPIDASLSIDDNAPGDPNAIIPYDPQSVDPTTSQATLTLDVPDDLPDGTTVTLSSNDATDAHVWDGVPGQSGSSELLGDGATSHTWTIGQDNAPDDLTIVGENGTSTPVTFTLAVAPASVEITGDGSTPPQGTPAAVPVKITQAAAVKQATPVVLGLFGANGPSIVYKTGLNDGNVELAKIANDVNAISATNNPNDVQHRLFESVDRGGAFKALLKQLDTNGDGKYDPYHSVTVNGTTLPPDKLASIRIFGHSWGGYTAVQLAMQIDHSSRFIENTIDVLATVDPVNVFRILDGPTSVPSNVVYYWNRYQSKGDGTRALWFFPVNGILIDSRAPQTDEWDLNPDGQQVVTAPGKYLDYSIDHFTIIWQVQSQLENLLLNGPAMGGI